VIALRRRSKYLLADLSGGETLLIHLGMSGRMLIHTPNGTRDDTATYVHTQSRAWRSMTTLSSI